MRMARSSMRGDSLRELPSQPKVVPLGKVLTNFVLSINAKKMRLPLSK